MSDEWIDDPGMLSSALLAIGKRPQHDEEDILHDAIIACREAKLLDPSKQREFLFAVIANRIRSGERKAKRREEILKQLPIRQPEEDTSVEDAEVWQIVRGAIDSLQDKERRALELHQEEISYVEIASELGTSPGNARVIVSRAKGSLRREVQKMIAALATGFVLIIGMTILEDWKPPLPKPEPNSDPSSIQHLRSFPSHPPIRTKIFHRALYDNYGGRKNRKNPDANAFKTGKVNTIVFESMDNPKRADLEGCVVQIGGERYQLRRLTPEELEKYPGSYVTPTDKWFGLEDYYYRLKVFDRNGKEIPSTRIDQEWTNWLD